MAARPLQPASPCVASSRGTKTPGGGVFQAHHEGNGARWPAPDSSQPFVKRPQLCLIDGVRSPRTDGAVRTRRGLEGERCAVAGCLQKPGSPPPSKIPVPFPVLRQPRPGAPPPAPLASRAVPGGRGEDFRLRESSTQIPRDSPAAAAAASYVFSFDKSPLLQQK